MKDIKPKISALGLSFSNNIFKSICLLKKGNNLWIKEAKTENVKQLDIECQKKFFFEKSTALVATTIDANSLFSKKVSFSFKNKSELKAKEANAIDSSLPREGSSWRYIKKIRINSLHQRELDLYGVKSIDLQAFISKLEKQEIFPDSITHPCRAFESLVKHLEMPLDPIVFFHLGLETSFLCVILKNVTFYRTVHTGYLQIQESLEKSGSKSIEDAFFELDKHLEFKNCLNLLKQELLRAFLSLKFANLKKPPQICLTGFFSTNPNWKQILQDPIEFCEFPKTKPQLLNPQNLILSDYALEIGCALHLYDSFPKEQFRKGIFSKDFKLETEQQKLFQLLAMMGISLTLLSASIFGGLSHLKHQVEKSFNSLISLAYPSKTAFEKDYEKATNEKKEGATNLARLNSKIEYLKTITQKPKIPFPLFVTTPKPEDVLAVFEKTISSLGPNALNAISLESFSYNLSSYPNWQNPVHKYQVEIEFSFVSASSKTAKEFIEKLAETSLLKQNKAKLQWKLQNEKYIVSFKTS